MGYYHCQMEWYMDKLHPINNCRGESAIYLTHDSKVIFRYTEGLTSDTLSGKYNHGVKTAFAFLLSIP